MMMTGIQAIPQMQIDPGALQKNLESTPNSGNTMARFLLSMEEADAQEAKKKKRDMERERPKERKVDRVERGDHNNGLNENNRETGGISYSPKPKHRDEKSGPDEVFVDPNIGHLVDFSA